MRRRAHTNPCSQAICQHRPRNHKHREIPCGTYAAHHHDDAARDHNQPEQPARPTVTFPRETHMPAPLSGQETMRSHSVLVQLDPLVCNVLGRYGSQVSTRGMPGQRSVQLRVAMVYIKEKRTQSRVQ